MNRTVVRRVPLPVTVTAVLALAAGCGGDGMGGMDHDSGSAAQTTATAGSSSAAFNAADVSFAQNMIVHHRQAVEMADLAATRAAGAEIRTLAAQIKAAQQPEIDTMTGWLTAWGQPVEPAGGHGGHSMPGMMSTADMDTLKAANGAAFDTQFARMMIDHHNGAIDMAREVQRNGSSPEVRKLAADIEKTQQAEVTALRRFVG
ncbi:DUF305 domain-containing protein [Virgisporangium ochraceum]|uniref:Lipoprotein n=1 Tax=Virgisporangium ochraceum TaxID=65505 RepID=A0A8J4EDI4_9ACTN|nr:DUF305 domain-containing protein [Virgisporangium ochraceum]GIJ70736.1 lipoprotein [Virgisporangium ochraceum]